MDLESEDLCSQEKPQNLHYIKRRGFGNTSREIWELESAKYDIFMEVMNLRMIVNGLEPLEADQDFEIKGTFSISSINLDGDFFTYSRLLDHYQYRVLQKFTVVDGFETYTEWKEVSRGPFIDRKKDKMWMGIGLKRIDMGGENPNIVVVSVRSNNQ